MSNIRSLIKYLAAAACVASVSVASGAENTANAQFVLTFTLTDVVKNGGESVTFETSSQVGDVRFEDIGPNSSTFADGYYTNPQGSIGSASASESVRFNGLDPFVDDYDLDSFGIGDSVVLTMNTSASATTPGSIYYGQVISDVVLFFFVYGTDTDHYTFHFDYDAQLTGTLDSTSLPGVTLGLGDGNNVKGLAETTVDGPANMFEVFNLQPDETYFTLGSYNGTNGLVHMNDSASGSFEVAFAPGDNNLSINFLSGLVVNATVMVPEPAGLSLLALGTLALLRRLVSRRGARL